MVSIWSNVSSHNLLLHRFWKLINEKWYVEINEVNDSDSIVYVTTKDFKIKNLTTETYLDDEAVAEIFPADPLTRGHILFARLRPKISSDIPGQELHLECKLSVSNAAHNGMYNVVSTGAILIKNLGVHNKKFPL